MTIQEELNLKKNYKTFNRNVKTVIHTNDIKQSKKSTLLFI